MGKIKKSKQLRKIGFKVGNVYSRKVEKSSECVSDCQGGTVNQTNSCCEGNVSKNNKKKDDKPECEGTRYVRLLPEQYAVVEKSNKTFRNHFLRPKKKEVSGLQRACNEREDRSVTKSDFFFLQMHIKNNIYQLRLWCFT